MELLDVYNNEGKTTGRIVERSNVKNEKFNATEHIAVVQIYIENDKGEYLIEKSAKIDGSRYLPVGGHISSGETHHDTIIRECMEEIGLDISNENIIYLGYILVDFPVRFFYYLKKNVDLNNLKLQESEVESVSYMTTTKIKELVEKGLMHRGDMNVLNGFLELRDKLK